MRVLRGCLPQSLSNTRSNEMNTRDSVAYVSNRSGRGTWFNIKFEIVSLIEKGFGSDLAVFRIMRSSIRRFSDEMSRDKIICQGAKFTRTKTILSSFFNLRFNQPFNQSNEDCSRGPASSSYHYRHAVAITISVCLYASLSLSLC
jgi:hypothetical protein